MMDEQSHAAAGPPPATSPPDREAPPASPSRSAGPSQGGDRPLILESDQKTVISKSPPLNVHMPVRFTVHEMGKLLVGERLGHFVLEEFVGGGGMGAVFRATDIELGRTVAVKVVSGAHNDEETLRRFKNEAQSAARLDHQNIARVYYVGEDKGWHYIVFEFIQGVNVRDLVQQKGPLPLDEALHYTLQVAEALEHAAKRDVVHRDIKPSNVLVMQNGMVKVVDMGLARLHQVESTANDLTASGVTLGTFDYISPEQARDPRSTDVRSDLYSLGCTLYFMLTGRPPFPQGTVLQKLLSHSSEPPPDPRDLRPELSEEVTEVLHTLLAKNPNDRYQTPADLIGRLLLLADELGLTLVGRRGALLVTRSSAPVSRLEASLPWAVPISVLILIVLMVEIFAPAQQIAVSRPRWALPVRETSADDAQSRDATPSTAETTSQNVSTQPATQARETDPEPVETATTMADTTTNTSNADTASGEQPATQSTSSDTESTAALNSGASSPVPDNSGETAATPAQGSNSNSGTAAQANVVPQAVQRIIVAGDDVTVPSDALRVATIEAAIQKAKDQSGIEVIELWFDGEVTTSPLVISATEKLEFRAGEKYQPILVFEPTLESLANDRLMIDISGGNSAWHGVHFRLELPSQPSSGWSLFGLREVESAEFRQCTFTIQNVDKHGSMLHEEVAFFEFVAPQGKRMEMGMNMGMDPMDMAMPPTSSSMASVAPELILLNCAARGQATFVRAEVAHPFHCSWHQGLLATNDRLFVLGGAVEVPQNWDALIEFELEQVTGALDKGLGLMDLRNKPHLIKLVLDLKECVLLTNYDAPLIEHQAVSDLDKLVGTGLRFHGDGNFYPPRVQGMMAPQRPRTHWRISTSDGKLQEVSFSDVTKEAWYEADDPKQNVAWGTSDNLPPPATRYDQHTKSQYILARNPARTAGFSVDEVPDFPEGDSAWPATAPEATAAQPD